MFQSIRNCAAIAPFVILMPPLHFDFIATAPDGTTQKEEEIIEEENGSPDEEGTIKTAHNAASPTAPAANSPSPFAKNEDDEEKDDITNG